MYFDFQSARRNFSYIPEPIRNGWGATDPGPRDILRDLENPDMLVPPATDAGLMPNLKFSFSDTSMVLKPGGWSREITAREMPALKTLAAVNMRLTPGGVREVHWHEASEWSLVLTGSARVTAVDQQGRNFIGDIHPGDLWYFPPRVSHALQGMADGCEFILLFDDGDFSDLNTLSLSDLFAHYPREVLSMNFGVPASEFRTFPSGQVYIYQGTVPGPLEEEAVRSPFGPVPQTFKHELMAQDPIATAGGSVRIADTANFHVAKTTAAALVEIKPGAMREIHWHNNNDEFQYYLTGQGRMTVFGENGRARTFNYRAGDVGYIPVGYVHYVQNTGNDTLWFLEAFRSEHFESISLNQTMALTPRSIVGSNLRAGPQFLDALRAANCPVIPCVSDNAYQADAGGMK
ncbi:oxalate decarboxylase [Sporobacter termitidis DSM 10068]|uniref:Oxalate decarboxylase n=1 Tax=Sporobacter termitidis DSM 10068 TaxID=1123282 RepID=A0A1M5TYD6_9FIRM|nr:cupin domain-containing protein [Sporobacter termitidis]SHH55704.1 oxalate decarboxylase [Sporobacter termitidis DSM 10068]